MEAIKEAIKVKDSRMYSLIVLYDMHSGFFHSVLDRITEEDAQNRLNTKANHIAWLAGSLVHERYELANGFAGVDMKQTSDEIFKDHKGIQDNVRYPFLDELRQDWDRITPVLRDALLAVNTQKLDTSFDMMPGVPMTYFDLAAFMMYREANCIGQIALWRRLLGYEAMKYM